MKRKYIVLFGVLLFIIAIFFVLKEISYYSKSQKGFMGTIGRMLNKTNSFNISYAGFDPSHIDVVWETETLPKDTLVKNGKTISNFGYEYGAEKFAIYDKNKLIYITGFFSTNDNVPHDVAIKITKTLDDYHFTSVIDAEKYERDVNVCSE